ncbi:TraX family protein [Serpentinicella sp. ANB-PHB4]|uniref:TraX family protein n=1 Tax=Serpentinicella sp. ANB-PHB4 TaxID=3074076 RepID=UPI0028677EC6|nr:TraX family protein [Serpentinicella sp. ANB-PHB4]MDR5659259.1 TraX family protein [Serpentinicella sp. ANB-PHB4]
MDTAQPHNTDNRTDILKLIAIITMLIDHIGALLFPDIIIFRIIGRIAFPIFAYHLVIGYKNTANLKKYVLRLSLFAVVSQIPFTFFGRGLNIFFTLLIGILAIYLYEKNRRGLLMLLFLSIPLFTYFIIYFDYELYGVLMILLFYIFYEDQNKTILSFTGLTLLYCIDINHYIQMYAIFALPLFYTDFKIKIRLSRYFFYAFYPVHITVLLIVERLFFS